MPNKHTYESAYTDARPAPDVRREAEWHTVPHTAGPLEIATTATLSSLIVVALIYAACVLLWGNLALGWWKAAVIAGAVFGAFPFAALAWRQLDLLQVVLNRNVAEHLTVIEEHNHVTELNRLQLAQLETAMQPQPPPAPIRVNRQTRDETLSVALDNGEVIYASTFAKWAHSGNLTIENATLNGLSRPQWEGACDWLSDSGLATVTSKGKTAKLLAGGETVRNRIFAVARPFYQLQGHDSTRYSSLEEAYEVMREERAARTNEEAQ